MKPAQPILSAAIWTTDKKQLAIVLCTLTFFIAMLSEELLSFGGDRSESGYLSNPVYRVIDVGLNAFFARYDVI